MSDGLVAGIWRIAGATLVIEAVVPLAKRVSNALVAEGQRVVRYLVPDSDGHDVRLARQPGHLPHP